MVPLSLSRGSPATAGCVGCALIASARHILANSALIGAVLFECAVGAVSANKVDPASATAMSGPRALMIVFMAATSDLTVFGGGNEPPRPNESQPPKTASRPEDPPANQDDRSLPASLWDGCSVCYWTDAAFVIARCNVCVWSGSQIVLFLQRSKIFF